MTARAVGASTKPRFGGSPTPRVVIAGAGIGGIAQAVSLAARGIDSFEVIERAPEPGGVWFHNRYPGAQVDIPSLLYSYGFHLIRWPRTHAMRDDILAYLNEVIDTFGLRDRMTFGVSVESAVWDERTHTYDIGTSDGRHRTCDVFVSAIGTFTERNPIDLPGADGFDGLLAHSAAWDDRIDLRGRRVAVVGAGASAAQIVPALAPEVDHLLSFQREPNWVAPKGDHDFSPEELADLSTLTARRKARAKILREIDSGLRVGSDPDGELARTVKERNLQYLQNVFLDRPDLLDALTPRYPLRCKRAVLSDDFLPALKRPNVTLVSRGVERFTRQGVVDSHGDEHDVDAVIMATGFQTTKYLAGIDLVGRDGRHIRGVWGKEPAAFLGMTVPGFPNFYMLYGPNTHGTVVTYVHEVQAEFIARDVQRLVDERATSIETRVDVFDRFQRKLEAGIGEVVAWNGGCNNYYTTTTGKNVVQWPWSHARFARWASRARLTSARLSSV